MKDPPWRPGGWLEGACLKTTVYLPADGTLSSVLRNAPLYRARLQMLNEISKPTVRNSSTIFFRRAGNLRTNSCRVHYSEPQALRLSSVEDVTATLAVQTFAVRFYCKEHRSSRVHTLSFRSTGNQNL